MMRKFRNQSTKKIERKVGRLCFILLSVLVLIANAKIVSGQPLQVMTEEFPPFNYMQDNRLKGISTEVVREILKRTGHSDHISVYSWSRGYNLILQNDHHVLFSTVRTKERENLFKWVGPLAKNNTVFFARKGSGIRLSSLDEAKKAKRVGANKDSVGEIILKDAGFRNIDTVLDNVLNLKKLVAGRIDLWIINEQTGRHLAKESDLLDKIETIYTVQTNNFYIAFSKSTPDAVIKEWQDTLDSIKADGTYEKVLTRYGVDF